MKTVNLIVIFNSDVSQVLMCHRTTEPYKGLYNFVGGKVEEGESKSEAAYRELYEETGIDRKDVSLHHYMNYQYLPNDLEMNIFYGILKHPVFLKEEKHPLEWFDLDENFLDDKFAGDGNVHHMITIALNYINND